MLSFNLTSIIVILCGVIMVIVEKLNSEGGVLCLTFVMSGLFATFTQ